jgi:3-oxoacid CoA-transferase B subunit
MSTIAAKPRLSRETMAARAAQEFQDGWIVNLGVGMPTLCSNFLPPGRRVILHSENGVIGYGRNVADDAIDPHTVNAGVRPVELLPFAAILHHADAFAVIRRGLLDVGVLGAYEVATNGDFANWRTAGRKGGGIGGAMDIAACARRIFVMLEHTTHDGQPRLRRRCSLPITAPGVTTLVITDLGVFQPIGEAYRLVEIAPGYTLDEVQSLTEAPIVADTALREVHISA